MSVGVISMGIHCPIIKEGDNLQQIVADSVLNTTELEDGDIIGITESVVARAEGNYVTVDDIARETDRIFGKNATIKLCFPIYSRNRFSMILKGIARSCKKIIMLCNVTDEVGNVWGVNPWTGVDIREYYREIVESEFCEYSDHTDKEFLNNRKYLICSLHDPEKVAQSFQDGKIVATLKDYFKEKCIYGLLGSNKATEEKIKLFPSHLSATELVYDISKNLYNKTGKNVDVMIYGDGCFKDPDSGIWEFADPVAAVAYTAGLFGHPNEIKIKAFADDKFKDLSGKELDDAIKNEILNKDTTLTGKMASQGTTPRKYVNLLASLMDLTSGSGDKGTPVVLVRNYFKNYANA